MSGRNGANHLCCPRCGGDLIIVNDSRPYNWNGEVVVKRARNCADCERNSNTIEITQDSLNKIFAELRSTKSEADKRVNTALAALKIFAEASQS